MSVENQKTTAITARTAAQISATACQQGHEHEGGQEFRHRGADIAGAEDAERRALFLGREEGRDIGHADCKGGAREAHAERGDQGLGVGARVGQQEGRYRCREHGQRADEPAAVTGRPGTKQDTDKRAGQDRHADQQAELRLSEVEVLLDPDADDREDRPDRKADGEGEGREPQRALPVWRRSVIG